MVKVVRIDRLDEDSPLPYVVLSGMVMAFLERLHATAPPAGFLCFVAGGAFYAIGLRFFIRDKRFDHAIWHVFSLAGSICHYAAVIAFVIAAPA
jgi:hemolysin III